MILTRLLSLVFLFLCMYPLNAQKTDAQKVATKHQKKAHKDPKMTVDVTQNGKNPVVYYDYDIIYDDPGFTAPLTGNPGSIDLSDIHVGDNTVALRLGHKNDLILVLFVEKNNKKITGVYRYFWRIQDGVDIQVKLTSNEDVLVVYGNNHDINRRLHFDTQTKQWQRGPENRVHKTSKKNYFPPGGEYVSTVKVK
ncbi:hypothetical protein SAMN06298216_1701 [Spirosomataceae bacterium TFI 002]|nr:hypothetical protein SAMN06298216_1701 [Spirosomataceae bacterium TFI 002]